MTSENNKTQSIPSLQVVLDNPAKVYFSGQMISGLVKFQIDQQHKVQILSINLIAEYFYYKNEQELVELIYTEVCPVDLGSAGEGNSEMPFSFVVRSNSPTSIVSGVGGIRYRVQSHMVLQNQMVDNALVNLEASEMVSVNILKQLVDNIPGEKVSAQQGLNLAPACCCGAISVDFEVASIALLCGNSAVINAFVNNNTREHIHATSVSLVQKVVRLKDKKFVKSTVASKERGAILPGKRQVWLSERFLIPPLPPTGSDSYFKVHYKFVLCVKKTSDKGLRLKIPLVIANLPKENDDPALNSQCSLGQGDSSLAEGMCSNDSAGQSSGYKPLYVTYVS